MTNKLEIPPTTELTPYQERQLNRVASMLARGGWGSLDYENVSDVEEAVRRLAVHEWFKADDDNGPLLRVLDLRGVNKDTWVDQIDAVATEFRTGSGPVDSARIGERRRIVLIGLEDVLQSEDRGSEVLDKLGRLVYPVPTLFALKKETATSYTHWAYEKNRAIGEALLNQSTDFAKSKEN